MEFDNWYFDGSPYWAHSFYEEMPFLLFFSYSLLFALFIGK